MRWCVLVVAAACGMNPPPRQTQFPTLELGETYYTRIAGLRTTLARAGIRLRVAGQDTTFSSVKCDPDAAAATPGSCWQCELAGEEPRMDGAVLEATTRAFARYPTDVLVRTRIAHVAVCRDIMKEGKSNAAAGVADVYGHGLLMSLAQFIRAGTYTGRGERNVDNIVHHEIFHLLEHELMRGSMFEDSIWNLANPIGFTYQAGFETESRRDGFVNAYAATSAVEDKASVYEYLMSQSDTLCELAKADELIRLKTEIIWTRVKAAVGTDSFMRAAAPCVDWITRT